MHWEERLCDSLKGLKGGSKWKQKRKAGNKNVLKWGNPCVKV